MRKLKSYIKTFEQFAGHSKDRIKTFEQFDTDWTEPDPNDIQPADLKETGPPDSQDNGDPEGAEDEVFVDDSKSES